MFFHACCSMCNCGFFLDSLASFHLACMCEKIGDSKLLKWMVLYVYLCPGVPILRPIVAGIGSSHSQTQTKKVDELKSCRIQSVYKCLTRISSLVLVQTWLTSIRFYWNYTTLSFITSHQNLDLNIPLCETSCLSASLSSHSLPSHIQTSSKPPQSVLLRFTDNGSVDHRDITTPRWALIWGMVGGRSPTDASLPTP